MRTRSVKQNAAVICTVLVTLLATAACNQQFDPALAREELLAADRAFAQMSVDQGAVAAFYSYLAEDALQLPDGSLPIAGREAIRESMAAAPAYTLKWTPVGGSVARSGDLGWTWGNYVAGFSGADGEPAESHGKYLNVWIRDAAGDWKVLVDMGNQTPVEDTTG